MNKVFRMLLLATLLLCGCKVDLYTTLPEDEATVMMARLLEHGIVCEKLFSKQGWALSLDKSDMSAAVRLLSAEGYPKRKFMTTGQIFGQRGLISSPQEDKIRYIYGISQEIAETITQMDGVLEARVHMVLPENDPLSDSLKPSSASVFVEYDPASQVRQNITQIKHLVLNGIEGLTIDKVSVISLPGKVVTVPPPVFTTVMGITMLKRSVGIFWAAIMIALVPFLVMFIFTFRNKIPWLRRKPAAAENLPAIVSQPEEKSLASL